MLLAETVLSGLVINVVVGIITGLLTAVFGMLGYWLIYARHYVDRDEVLKIVNEQSPYLKDKMVIMDRLANKDKILEDLSKTVNEMFKMLQDLRLEIVKITVEMKHREREE